MPIYSVCCLPLVVHEIVLDFFPAEDAILESYLTMFVKHIFHSDLVGYSLN